MRPGIISENPLEWLGLRLGLIPRPLLDGYWGMATSRVLLTAVELGVFDALADGPLTAAEVAGRLATDPFGTEVLLDALNGMRYLVRRDARYANSRLASRWLETSSREALADAILFFDDLWGAMTPLTEMVRTGEVANLHYQERPPEFWRHYISGLASFARLAGPAVARKVRLPKGSRRLLDVGGGHGLYAAAFARRNPDLSAQVLDLPEACEIGRETIAAAGLEDRVSFREADARSSDWGRDWDAILLFNLLHNLTPEESCESLARAHEALKPGGLVVVLDSEYQGSGDDLSITAGLNEMLFFLTSGTRAYPEQTMRRWISEAGFSEIRTSRLAILPMTALITAVA